MDQDSERTSSLLTQSKPSSSRRQSRAPRPGLVAGIDELDALGTLSLRPSQANGLRGEQSSEGGSRDNARAVDNSADDMTVVAHSGRVSEGGGYELDAVREQRRSSSEVSPVESESARSMVAPAKAKPDVNPRRAQALGSTGKSEPLQRSKAKEGAGGLLMLQWALASAIVFAAAWYVLRQPAPQHIERHWVSGRAR